MDVSGNARTGTLQFEVNSTPRSGSLFTFTDRAGNAAIGINIPKQSQGNLGLANVNTAASNIFTPTSFTPYVGIGTISVTHSISNVLSSVFLTGTSPAVCPARRPDRFPGILPQNIFTRMRSRSLQAGPCCSPASAGFGLIGAAMRRSRTLQNV